jgi:hypothetical protein
MLKVSILGRRATRDVCLEFWTDQLLNASTRERHENPQHERAENRDGPIPKRPRGTAGSCGSGHTCQCCHCRVEITPAERAGLFKWGTAELSDDLKADLSRLLADGLARVAAEYAITLLTGGTDAGIFSLLGDGLAKWERKAPCIGVTPAAPVTWPGREKGDTPLEPHHSHFVVVEGKEWGDETRTMYSVAQALGRDCSLHCRIRWWRRRDLARDAGQRGSRPRDDLGRGQRPQDGRGAGHPRRLEYVRQSASGDRVKRQDHSFRNRWVSGAIRATG